MDAYSLRGRNPDRNRPIRKGSLLMALTTSPRPIARPTGPAWERTVRIQRERERTRTRIRRDVRQRPAAPPKNIDSTPRLQISGVLSALRRISPLALILAPSNAADGSLEPDNAALAANYEAHRVYGQSRADGLLTSGVGPNIDLDVPALTSPLPPAWLVPELNPAIEEVLTREQPDLQPAPDAENPMEYQDVWGLPRPASPRMQETLNSAYAPRTSVRPRARPRAAKLTVRIEKGKDGTPKIRQRVAIRPRKSPKKGRQERKDTSKVAVIQTAITKTYGAYTEARDMAEAIAWAVYTKDRQGRIVHAPIVMSLRDIALAIIADDPAIRVDWVGVVQNIAIMQMQDRAIGEFSKRRQKHLNALGWDNPLGIDAMSSSGQSSARSQVIAEDIETGTDNREMLNALRQKPSILREVSEALNESLDRKSRVQALF